MSKRAGLGTSAARHQSGEPLRTYMPALSREERDSEGGDRRGLEKRTQPFHKESLCPATTPRRCHDVCLLRSMKACDSPVHIHGVPVRADTTACRAGTFPLALAAPRTRRRGPTQTQATNRDQQAANA